MHGITRAEALKHLSSLTERHEKRPAAALALSFLLGIVLSSALSNYAFAGLAAACVFLLAASFTALRRDRLALSAALALAALCLSGLLTALARRDRFGDSHVRSFIARGAFRLDEPVLFEGCVSEDSVPRGTESVAVIELHAFLQKERWIPIQGKGMLRIAENADEGQPPATRFSQGDRIRGWAVWRLPHNYGDPGSADRKGSLARRGIYLTGRVKSARLLESTSGGCSGFWTRWTVSARNRVRTSLEPIRTRDKGQPAAALASLVIGEYSGLDNTTRAAFQNSGTLHVLVVSGLHVAWLAGLLFQFFKLLRFPERIRFLLTALAIVFYTCVVGFQASITRCLWMFILYLVGRTILRRSDPVNILSVSALILLAARPDWPFEAGFQLSFLSVMAIATTAVPAIEARLVPLLAPLRHCADPDRRFLDQGAWHRRGRSLRVRCEILIEETADSFSPAASHILLRVCRALAGAGMAVAGMIVISLSIQLWIEPVLAYHFNRISWISPAANLLMVPFSSLVLASGIAASIGAQLPFCGPALVRVAGELSSLFLRCTSWISSFDAGWLRCPTPAAPWVWSGILILFAWGFFQWRRFWIPCAYVGSLLAFLSVGGIVPAEKPLEKAVAGLRSEREVLQAENAPILSLTFLDVGEGDSILIRLPGNKTWLLDAGGLLQSGSPDEGDHAFDIGEAVVSRYLWHMWIIRLDRLILSHMDLDHAGGAGAILRNFKVDSIHYPFSARDALGEAIQKAARRKEVREHLLYAGIQENVGPVMVRVLHPPHRPLAGTSNDNSLVMQVSCGLFSALLTGDVEKKGEIDLLSRPGNLESLLLKVAHHGSRWGTSAALLERVRPRWAVLSAGRYNPHGHPSPDVLRRLLRRGVRFYQTSDDGAVTFETDGRHYVIRSYIRGILEEGEI